MMPHLHDIYNKKFFEEWGPKNAKYTQSARIVTDLLFNAFIPRRLVDIGCGCGVYSHFFKEKGVEVVSLDGVVPAADIAFPIKVIVRDLTVPFKNVWGSFDMALCLEVAEHIPEQYVAVFLKNITHLSDVLILSAAPPHQGGHHHVNEQPKRYWVKRMAELGFAYNRKKTGVILEKIKKIKMPYMWMGEHLSVYERVPPGKPLKWDMPFQTRMT